VNLRDELENTLREWDLYEVGRGAPPVIDFDCYPSHGKEVQPSPGRLAVHRNLTALHHEAMAADDTPIVRRINAHLAYLEALMGARLPLDVYIRATQGCAANGWSAEYVTAIGDLARKELDDIGAGWNSETTDTLDAIEEPLAPDEAPDAIRAAATELEADVRRIVDSSAPFDLRIEIVDVDAYWAYWLDGRGSSVRMRINSRRARFTKIQAKQFALHEILGHGLQGASYSDHCAKTDVPWIRMTSVHCQQQVLLEGLAQVMPLFIAPDDKLLTARVRLSHYTELVRSQLHLLINDGVSISDCVAHARSRVPFWTDEHIADFLTDRSVNPLLRSYLWAYPAGIDWFVALANDGDAVLVSDLLRLAYRQPLTPQDLEAAWPSGPAIGGPAQISASNP
jgi:hypothetical protein